MCTHYFLICHILSGQAGRCSPDMISLQVKGWRELQQSIIIVIIDIDVITLMNYCPGGKIEFNIATV